MGRPPWKIGPFKAWVLEPPEDPENRTSQVSTSAWRTIVYNDKGEVFTDSIKRDCRLNHYKDEDMAHEDDMRSATRI